ncbi:MAG: nitroreductase family deazaflavin-dependent oxidoreductase [Myxococcota bacterium]|nr:nitroreductase family deazaflavin-dependent oxidoreductase [Myxococcales bacterium]
MKLDRVRRRLERAWNCGLTTVGRRSGAPRRVTIWFALDGDDVVLTGGPEGPHWVRNLAARSDAVLEIAGVRLVGRARVVDDAAEQEAIRDRFVRRYLGARLSKLFGGYTRSTCVRVAIDRVEDARA